MPVTPHSKLVYKRRRRVGGWRAIPRSFAILTVASLALMVAIPLSSRAGWFKKHPPELTQIASSSSPVALELDESQFQPQSRTIKGVLENKSDQSYKEVVISYNLRTKEGMEAGVVDATLGGVGPHAKARFETTAFPKEASTYELREITGTVR